MRRTTVLWETYVTRFEEALDPHKKRPSDSEEAGELLGLSARHFRRMCGRYEEDRGGRPAGSSARPGDRSGERRRANWSACVGFTERATRTSR